MVFTPAESEVCGKVRSRGWIYTGIGWVLLAAGWASHVQPRCKVPLT